MEFARKIGNASFIFALLTALYQTIAHAGHYASRDIIGFSPDGRYFAFEQYGVEDGSGFPYAEIFLIDTTADQWVKGYPVRKRLDDEKATVGQVRKDLTKTRDILKEQYRVSEPGDHLASNPRAELSADPHLVIVNAAHRFTPPKQEPYVFTLTEKTIQTPDCAKYTDLPTKGFKLTMTRKGEDVLTLNDDQSLPGSRRCALGYAIADVLSHDSGGNTAWVVLLHLQTFGFEGPDSTFMAVARRLP